MKWKITLALAILAVLTGTFVSHLRSQDKQVNSEQAQAKVAAMLAVQQPQLKWSVLPSGASVLRLWEVGGPAWPQIAVLQISQQQYDQLRANPSNFVNSEKIFPVAVRPGAKYIEIESLASGANGQWFVISVHRPGSGSVNASFPATDPVPTPSGN